MRFLSVCSGIEAASVAWQSLGWEPVAFSEIEAFPNSVLAHHYPTVPNWGDLTKFKDWPDAAIDLLVGGTPCQSFSVAGLRKGLDDPRGNLTLTYLAVAARYRPRWLVWENVPGVLSDATGAFGAFLGGLAELGYGFAYRVLDAQHFGVPQRRRRVFVVGCLGGWRRAAAVLFEPESLSGHPAPSRETGKRIANAITERPDRGGGNSEGQRLIAPTLPSRMNGGGGLGTDFDCDGGLVANSVSTKWRSAPEDSRDNVVVAQALRAGGREMGPHGALDGENLVPIDLRQASRGEKITNNRAHGSGGAPGHGVGEAGDPAFTVSERGQAIAFDERNITSKANRSRVEAGRECHTLHEHAPAIAIQGAATRENLASGPDGVGVRSDDVAFTLEARQEVQAVAFANTAGDTALGMSRPSVPPLTQRNGDPGNVLQGMTVRRLTPRECERLQGFPDDYTLVPYRGKSATDGPRYKALGNSMAVPVVRWIGERIVLLKTTEHRLPTDGETLNLEGVA